MTDVFIHPLAVVDEGADIGNGTRIWHFAHVRGTAKLGTGCNIGKDVYIDGDVTIGNNVKIQNGVSVYHGRLFTSSQDSYLPERSDDLSV